MSNLCKNVKFVLKCKICVKISNLCKNVKLVQKCQTCSKMSNLFKNVNARFILNSCLKMFVNRCYQLEYSFLLQSFANCAISKKVVKRMRQKNLG